MKATVVQPYLIFSGRCDEALAFYAKAIGAKVEMLMRFNESPTPMPPGSIPSGFEKKVMHVSFRVGENVLMGSDGNGTNEKFDGFSLSLALPDEQQATAAFAALKEGGEVVMPLGKTFWSPCFGMLKDKFGLRWMITVAS